MVDLRIVLEGSKTSRNNNINSRLDATIINFIGNYNQLKHVSDEIMPLNMLRWL